MASYFTKFGKGKEFSLVDGNEEKSPAWPPFANKHLLLGLEIKNFENHQ